LLRCDRLYWHIDSGILDAALVPNHAARSVRESNERFGVQPQHWVARHQLSVALPVPAAH
jgi:hypothetical protein